MLLKTLLMLLGWVVVRKIKKAKLSLFLFPFSIPCLALLLSSFLLRSVCCRCVALRVLPARVLFPGVGLRSFSSSPNMMWALPLPIITPPNFRGRSCEGEQ